MSLKDMLAKKRAAKLAKNQANLARDLERKEEMRINGIKENFDYWLETCPELIPESFWAIVGKRKAA